MALKVKTYKIETGMGKVSTYFGHPLDFLTDKEKNELDELGYTGKHNGERMTRETYLNSLGKGTFDVTQDKRDSGDFSEAFTISRAWDDKDDVEMETRSITYTKYYRKTKTKDVKVPKGLEGDDLYRWLDNNADFDDVHDASLDFDRDEYDS